jgi:hypothetical protein
MAPDIVRHVGYRVPPVKRIMMEQQRTPWQIGDRVRTRGHVLDLPSGTLGTIEQALPFGDIYSVRFDAQPESQFLQRRALELVSAVPREREGGK